MAIPATTYIFKESMDPYDVVDYVADVSGMLEAGEAVASFNLLVPAESALLGFELKTSGGYATTLTNSELRFWASINATKQTDPAFISGATIPVEINITTNSTPPRKKQRTLAVKVIHK